MVEKYLNLGFTNHKRCYKYTYDGKIEYYLDNGESTDKKRLCIRY